ncbi:MAG: biotin transporter BioY [Anaerolineales bacterium]|nr:biotin transporter BioY [Anaerolineales bacterium]MCS7248863.1 biotin transporter BioY [Anaerolineales bacterium]MDW8162676.1 biotin transporter BioY [Anaerolineales bacterium]MDW8447696.1 biotin transporter BioY [Anaerolineales bacterium]
MTLTTLFRPAEKKAALVYQLSLVLAGSWLIALAAQVSIPLPFSPVPITGQTFAVLLVGALLGRRLAGLSVAAYLAQGLAGLPVFAGGTSGLARLLGPTGGYLVGFLAAAYLVGYLAERGWTLQVGKTLLAMILGNVLIYLCGVSYLALFLGFEKALTAGLYPFLVGDAIKILLATLLLPLGWKVLSKFT